MFRAVLTGIVVSVLCLGCQTVARVHQDQAGARDAITDLQSDQIFDNVVRLYNGLPIVHIDYKEAQARTQDTVGGNASTAWSRDRTSNSGPHVTSVNQTQPMPSDAVTTVLNSGRQLVQKFNAGGDVGGSSVSWLQLDADPVVNTPHAKRVYSAYLDFLRIEGSVQRSRQRPCEGAAVIEKRYANWWFYIPATDPVIVDAYRILALTTVGYTTDPPKTPVVKTTIAGFGPFNYDDTHLGHHDVPIDFTSAVDNKDGHMIVTVGNVEMRLNVSHLEGLPTGSKTQQLTLQYPTRFLSIFPWDRFSVIANNREVELKTGRASDGGGHNGGGGGGFAASNWAVEDEYVERKHRRELHNFLQEGFRAR